MRVNRWSDESIKNLMMKLRLDVCYRLLKEEADAIAYKGVDRKGDECFFVAENSKMNIADDVFLKNDLLFICDYRRISVESGDEKDGVAMIRVAFRNPREAAQFVLADIAAKAEDWQEIKLGSVQC